jgi:hypothetical protein
MATAVQNLEHRIGLDCDGYRFLSRAVQHCRRQAARPEPPGFVFAAAGSQLRGNRDLFPHEFLSLGRGAGPMDVGCVARLL